MWKFKTSIYKNAAPKASKREDWIGEISAGNIGSSCGNHIKASAAYMAFNIDAAGGSSIGLLPVGTQQRLSGLLPTIQAHSSFVTDFDFCAFDDFLLSTCSQDGTAKIWHLPVDGTGDSVCNPACELANEGKTIENIMWNPAVENVLALSVQQAIKVYDVERKSALFELRSHNNQIQNFSWKIDGTLIASTCKDKKLRVFDVRNGADVQCVDGHQNIKDSRVLWLGDKNLILTTGFCAMRQRELTLRDTRNLSAVVKNISVDSSTGTLMPLYDADTGMIFLAGKGDTSVRYLELSEKDPFLVENSVERVEQVIKGVGLISKRAVDVMRCEVDRLLVLTPTFIVPLSYCVPRKSYREFQSELFPDTFDGQPLLTVSQWLSGDQPTLSKTLSLNPMKKSTLKLWRPFGTEVLTSDTKLSAPVTSSQPESNSATVDSQPQSDNSKPSCVTKVVEADIGDTKAKVLDKSGSVSTSTEHTEEPTAKAVLQVNQNSTIAKESKPSKVFTGVRQCKFRHVEGSTMHRSLHIDNVRNISQSVPGESDGFQANPNYCAIPLNGPGGIIAVVKTNKPGRLPDTGVPTLQNGSTVTDLVWDPFDNSRLAVACDDAKIRIWNISAELDDSVETVPSCYLKGHTEKIYFIRFHPLASSVLTSASYDMTVRVWDIENQEERIKLRGHTDTIFSLAWSSDGKRCATVCKDGKIRIYDPRSSADPILEGVGLEGSRGGRVVWVCDDSLLAVTGFDRMSMRQVAVYDATNLSEALDKLDLDTSPAILVPHYDADSSVLFVTGRGDSTVRTFEICTEAPYINALSNFKGDGLHQALSFLPKNQVNVRNVEFARCMRLTSNSIEPISFRVPRLRTEYFQDDLFPDTRVTWQPVLTSAEWFAGSNGSTQLLSLRPSDMQPLSTAPAEPSKRQKYESFDVYAKTFKTDEQKKEELLSALTNKLQVSDEPLPQDLTEGVDPDEWDD